MEFNKNEEEKQDTSHLFNEAEEVGDKEKQYFTIDRNPRDFQPNLHKNPYEEAGFFSLLFFNWVNPLINVSTFNYLISGFIFFNNK